MIDFAGFPEATEGGGPDVRARAGRDHQQP